jgi:hypothetical protein
MARHLLTTFPLWVLLPVTLNGCGATVSVGLANVPRSDTHSAQVEVWHDVVANGTDSCSTANGGSVDPLGRRSSKCPSSSGTLNL